MKEQGISGEWSKGESGALERKYTMNTGMYVEESILPSLGIYTGTQRYPNAVRMWTEFDTVDFDNEDTADLVEMFKENNGTSLVFPGFDKNTVKHVYIPEESDKIITSVAFQKSEELLPIVLYEFMESMSYITAEYDRAGLSRVTVQPELETKGPLDSFEDWHDSFPAFVNYIRSEASESLEGVRRTTHILQKKHGTSEAVQKEAESLAWILTADMADELAMDRQDLIHVLISFGWFDSFSDALLQRVEAGHYRTVADLLNEKGKDRILNEEVGIHLYKLASLNESTSRQTLSLTGFGSDRFEWSHNEIQTELMSEEWEQETIWAEGVGSTIEIQDSAIKIEEDNAEDGRFIVFTCSSRGKTLWSASLPDYVDVDAVRELSEDKKADFRQVDAQTRVYFDHDVQRP